MDKAHANEVYADEPISDLLEVCHNQRSHFRQGFTLDYDSRMKNLLSIKKLIQDNEQSILDVLKEDLQKPEYEAYASEIGFLLQEVNLAIRHLKRWMKVQKVSTGILNMPSTSRIIPEPKGVCLIIAPWNYPFHLIFAPMIPALAAGNTVVLKPAEHAPATARLIQTLIGDYFNPRVARVFLGNGAQIIPQLMERFRFDHVFFTGSTSVGKKIAQQAAKKLVPVTLELGGKNPCIVDESASLKVAARRILWAKILNAGQTCLAPDYLLVHATIYEEFKSILIETLNEFYPQGALKDEHYSGIVDRAHMDHLIRILDGGKVLYGGTYDEDSLRMEPCLIKLESADHPAMEDEIFGPILPILTYTEISAAKDIIDLHPYPLSLYYFGNDQRAESYFSKFVQAGSMAVNNAVVHFTNSKLAFGGIGDSGQGNYHGYHGFKTFSHYKSVMKSATWFDPDFKYPPYSSFILKLVKRWMR